MADQKIAGAYVEIYQKGAEKVAPVVQRMKEDVNRVLPVEDTGHLEKVLFGRHGSAGIERSLLHTVGHLGRMFGSGGLFALGAGLGIQLGESLFKTAIGFDKTAAAADLAAKKLETFNKTNEKAIELSQQAERASVAAKGALLFGGSPSAVDKTTEAINKKMATAEELRSSAARVRSTPEEIERMLTGVQKGEFGPGAEGARKGIQSLQEGLGQRQKQLRDQADEEEHKARVLRNQQVIRELIPPIGGLGSVAGSMADFGQRLFGAAHGPVALGINALQNQLGGNPLQQQLNAARLPNLAAGFDRRNVFDIQKLSVDELEKRGAQLQARTFNLSEREHNFQGRSGGATDIGSIGAQIQAAILDSPFEREWMEIDKEQRDLLKEIARRGPGAPAVAVVAPNR
jgi:hypothetical protein